MAVHDNDPPRQQDSLQNSRGMKVGGQQASCATMVDIMTPLYSEQPQAGDRVSVKPHASPAQHGINYLLAAVDEAI